MSLQAQRQAPGNGLASELSSVGCFAQCGKPRNDKEEKCTTIQTNKKKISFHYGNTVIINLRHISVIIYLQVIK